MSVALPRPAVALYREEQHFPWWVYAVVGAMIAMSLAGLRLQKTALRSAVPALGSLRALEIPFYLLVGLGLPIILFVGVLHMTTEVAPGTCRVWFGCLASARRQILLSHIRSVSVVRYHAIREHGFWGLRRSRGGELVMTARGDQAVRIVLLDGTTYLIGSQRAEELASVLDRERCASA